MSHDFLMLDEKKIARILSISRSLFRTMVNDGRFGPMAIYLGQRRLWRRSDVIKWIEWECPHRQQFLEHIDQEGGQRDRSS